MNKVIIRGFKRDRFSAEELEITKQSKLELKSSYQFSSSRSISEEHALEFQKDDLLEFVFEDNTTWTGSPDIIHDIFPKAARQTRAAGDSFTIPMYLETDESNRGLFGDIALKVLNVFTKKAVAGKVIDIAASLEKKILGNETGMYAVDAGFKLKKSKITETKRPSLLFIHGTNSSTTGSFAEIKSSELWKYMQDAYGGNIFGLQHETMTKSPIQNVINVFKELPAACTLHVITHSRGGLVGDVLARFCNGNKGFTDQEILYLEKTKRKTDIDDIKALQKLAAGKNIVIEKFIRVACPAYGTTILSKRLDHFLNISFNLISLVGGVTSLIAAEFKNLVSAAVDTKNDPNQLPGLEAMNPDSPFLKILNSRESNINGPLSVISGNCGIKFNLKALLIIASKLFYMRDNDLVVDTKSMYCGTKREKGIQYFFDEGPEVDHMHYFKNKKTQDALYAALKATEKIPGFTNYKLSDAELKERNALLGLDGGEIYTDKVSGNRPIVIVLPGIMGSNLQANEKRIWINYIRFLTGELSRLDISKQNVEAVSLIKTSYKKLVDQLKNEYDVITLPFDWRRPLADAATILKDCIEKNLKFKQPIKIIGHSMGGVVTRDFIINHPATWKKLNASKDFKLLLLGAPLGGSYRIPYVLAGKDSIINQLSKIDLRHTKKELLDMFRKYPGLLGLLPIAKAPHDFADIKTWQEMKNASLFNWSIPDINDLQFFDAYRNKVLEKMDVIEMDNIIYIAGKDDATVCDYEINSNLPDEKIVFKSTGEGDQSVTWETGIPKNINKENGLYFVDVSHGGLANEPDIFKGISEILATGKTELLSKDKPVVRAINREFNTVEEEVYDIDETNLETQLLGIKSKPKVVQKGRMPVKVSVSNGDLFYSRYPVLVGHFLTDGITSAEAVIDNHSGNILREWHRLNLYPGEIGSSEVFINLRNEFRGTVVIGLGVPGRLSAFQLAKSVEQGAIKYMLELKKLKKNDEKNELLTETGISVLLIGCGYGGLSVESSIRAILQGIQNANNKIESLSQEGLNTIERIEFVELYEDRCLQCLLVLSKIEDEADDNLNIRMTKKQPRKLLGSRTRIPMDTGSDWWNRISVVLHKEENKETRLTETALRFSSSTGSAREEQRDLQSSPVILDKLIDEMSTKNRWNEGLAKTVFELLIPNDFKDDVKKQSNTMWVLDTTSAAYPWELLQDGSSNADPICCNTGMIRQLQTDKYRLNINAASGNKALVIGDPDLNGYTLAPQLPGAFAEANLVAGLLDAHGYVMPNNCFRKSASQIVQAVFKDEYRIMHLAGHGIFNEKTPDQSGMLIGNDVFLSTKEICQMSKVPDLVFVNCCFLGKMVAQAEEIFSNRYKLAANIGTQLIMNGVKVVIAAGWAVDDKAALRFTEVFYNELLAGEEFGKAIKKARAKTFEDYPTNNTWGAYQCYGDPFFKLTNIPRPFAAPGKKGPGEPRYKFFIAQEAEIALSNIINRADTKSYTPKYLENDLKEIIDAIDKAGIRNAAVIEKEATAYAECNDYENAINKFKSLLNAERAIFTVKALEQYCNMRAKQCVKDWQTGKKPREQVKEIDSIIKDLNRLNEISETAERLSLLGSAYKRKAMMGTTKNEKLTALLKAADFYKKAESMEQNTNAAYSQINWFEIENILVHAGKHKWAAVNARPGKMISLKLAKEKVTLIKNNISKPEVDMDFWDEISIANACLCLWLLEGKNTTVMTEKKVVDTYLGIWKRAGSQNKKIAEIEHFDFLIDVYSVVLKSPGIVRTVKKIRNDLKNFLE
ncbi:MAG: CHAT domain-containing protein [Ferruginibacter sp.]